MPDANMERNSPQVLVDTGNLTREEWMDWRRHGIGGSDVSAIIGISPFRTARDIYYDKLGIAAVEEDEGNWVAMEMGHLLEDLVAKIFERRTGLKIYQIKKMFRHSLYPFMLADVDYFITMPDGTEAILEIKTTNYNAKDLWWKDGRETVPVYYEAQGRHYMAVMNIDRVFFCCLYGNTEDETIIREIRRDMAYEEEMIFLEQEFWDSYVQKQVPPPYLEDGDVILASARKYCGQADKDSDAIVLDGTMPSTLMRYMQLQVEQWHEIVPKTKEGVLSYLGSGLIKGIGEKTAAEIVAKFGTNTLDILEKHPERLLEVRGIRENKLEDIRTSFAESRMLRDIMTLLAPFKLTPKTALKIYQHFGPACLDLLKKSPFKLCQIPGFGFRRVDAIVRKTDDHPRDPMRIRGALHCTLDEAKGKQGHLFLGREELCKTAFKMLNEKIPLPEMRVHPEEVDHELDAMILGGSMVSMRDSIYHPGAFAQEDETASRIARLLAEERPPMTDILATIETVRTEQGLRISGKQESAVRTAFLYNLSVITGSPGTGKTTVLKIILEVYRRMYPDRKIVLMALRAVQAAGWRKAPGLTRRFPTPLVSRYSGV